MQNIQGQIREFSIQDNRGVIVDQQGNTYPFTSQSWLSTKAPMMGESVSFSVDAQGQASNVQPLNISMPQALNQPVHQAMSQPTAQGMSQPMANPYQAPSQPISPVHRGGLTGNEALWDEEEGYGFFDWVKKCLRNYANFNGRARRKEYWYFYLFAILVYIAGAVVDAMIGTEGIVAGLLSLGLAVPTMAASARRLHDIGKSGWWILLSLIPLVGLITIVWLATDTKPESNQWGAPARRLP